jgi:hypothetical protein
MEIPSRHSFCTRERAQDRTAITAWVTMIECDLRAWAERLTVVEYNFLRMSLDDAAHRALYWGYSDTTPDSFSGADHLL